MGTIVRTISRKCQNMTPPNIQGQSHAIPAPSLAGRQGHPVPNRIPDRSGYRHRFRWRSIGSRRNPPAREFPIF